MGAVRIIILVVAAVFAVGLALIVRGLAAHKPPPPPPVIVAQAKGEPMARVLVARRDLPTGTRLGQGDLDWQAWPAASVNPAFITDGRAPEVAPATSVAAAEKSASHAVAVAADTVVGGPMEARYGSIVREPLLANEPVTDAKLVRGGEGGYLAVVLHPGMRAIAVPITVATAVGGFVLPGDRVDVLQSHPTDPAASGGRAGFVAQVLLRNIKVLAVDQGAQPPKVGQAMIGAVATLEVAAADAEVLVRAKAQGDVILTLRAYADAGGATGRVGGGNAGMVRILRNGQLSEMMVTP